MSNTILITGASSGVAMAAATFSQLQGEEVAAATRPARAGEDEARFNSDRPAKVAGRSWARVSRAVVMLSLLALTACGADPESGGPMQMPKPLVTVQAVAVESITEWDEYLGRLEPARSVEIRARVNGYLREIRFKDGQLVKKGEPLFDIDARPFEALRASAVARVNEAQSDLKLKTNDLKRAIDVAESSRAISAEEVDSRKQAVQSADARLQSAKAALNAAELDVEYTQIKSPITGRIGRHLSSVGNLVQADQTLLARVVSLDPIHCYFTADERAYLRYTRMARSGERPSSRDVANPVRLALADESDFVHEGSMDFVDNVFDEATGTIRGRAVLANKDGLLAPGMFAKIRLLGRSDVKVVMIPEAAIATNQSERFVFVINDAEVATYRPVELGRQIDGRRVIVKGLSAGDRVVVRGMQRLREGDEVRTQAAEPAGEAK